MVAVFVKETIHLNRLFAAEGGSYEKYRALPADYGCYLTVSTGAYWLFCFWSFRSDKPLRRCLKAVAQDSWNR